LRGPGAWVCDWEELPKIGTEMVGGSSIGWVDTAGFEASID